MPAVFPGYAAYVHGSQFKAAAWKQTNYISASTEKYVKSVKKLYLNYLVVSINTLSVCQFSE